MDIKKKINDAFGVTVYVFLLVALMLMIIGSLSKDHVESELDWIRPEKKW